MIGFAGIAVQSGGKGDHMRRMSAFLLLLGIPGVLIAESVNYSFIHDDPYSKKLHVAATVGMMQARGLILGTRAFWEPIPGLCMASGRADITAWHIMTDESAIDNHVEASATLELGRYEREKVGVLVKPGWRLSDIGELGTSLFLTGGIYNRNAAGLLETKDYLFRNGDTMIDPNAEGEALVDLSTTGVIMGIGRLRRWDTKIDVDGYGERTNRGWQRITIEAMYLLRNSFGRVTVGNEKYKPVARDSAPFFPWGGRLGWEQLADFRGGPVSIMMGLGGGAYPGHLDWFLDVNLGVSLDL